MKLPTTILSAMLLAASVVSSADCHSQRDQPSEPVTTPPKGVAAAVTSPPQVAAIPDTLMTLDPVQGPDSAVTIDPAQRPDTAQITVDPPRHRDPDYCPPCGRG